MLIACERCHRQYDVGDLAPGSKVRCACAHLNEVPRVRPKRVAVRHCGNCGGARAEKGPCAYCGAPPAATRETGTACPECFARLPEDARFCHGCGTELAPESVVRAITRTSCPRCEGKLILVEGRGDPFHQCSTCGGIWLSVKAFQRFVDRSAGKVVPAEAQRSASRIAFSSPGVRRRRTRARRERRPSVACPTCGAPMLVTRYAEYSGIEVDHCVRHGWWFDGDELERIGRWVAGGGLEHARRRRAVARRSRHRVRLWRERIARERGGDWLPALIAVLANGD